MLEKNVLPKLIQCLFLFKHNLETSGSTHSESSLVC